MRYELEICGEVVHLKAADEASAKVEAERHINGAQSIEKIGHYIASNTSVIAEIREVRVVERMEVYQAKPEFFPG